MYRCMRCGRRAGERAKTEGETLKRIVADQGGGVKVSILLNAGGKRVCFTTNLFMVRRCEMKCDERLVFKEKHAV